MKGRMYRIAIYYDLCIRVIQLQVQSASYCWDGFLWKFPLFYAFFMLYSLNEVTNSYYAYIFSPFVALSFFSCVKSVKPLQLKQVLIIIVQHIVLFWSFGVFIAALYFTLYDCSKHKMTDRSHFMTVFHCDQLFEPAVHELLQTRRMCTHHILFSPGDPSQSTS